MDIIAWCNDNQGFTFVVLTAVYVIATIFICGANLKSAKASKMQTNEQRRQFDEVNRPKIDVSLELIKRGFVTLKIENSGKKYAKNVNVIINKEFLEILNNFAPSKHFDKISASTYNLGIGQKWHCFVCAHHEMKNIGGTLLIATVTYSDAHKEYKEVFNIDFSQYNWMLIYDSPLDEIRSHQKKISETIEKQLRIFNKINSNLEKEV